MTWTLVCHFFGETGQNQNNDKQFKGAGGGTIQKSSPLDKGGTLEPKWQRIGDLLYEFFYAGQD